VLILSERLHSVTAHFDGLRAVRFQEAIEKTIPRWKKGMVGGKANGRGADIIEIPNQEPVPALKPQHQLLDDETHALQVFYFWYHNRNGMNEYYYCQCPSLSRPVCNKCLIGGAYKLTRFCSRNGEKND
jgi:hypothetical protein